MRRASFTGVSCGGGPGEPLIVVEETGGIAEEDEEGDSHASSPAESVAVNQYLLTPYRDLRKRSLPTPPCTSGITASQFHGFDRQRLKSPSSWKTKDMKEMDGNRNFLNLGAEDYYRFQQMVRRLSERGGEGSGPSPIEQAFLATLSQAPAPQPGARRHSVVTISRAPPPCTLFGRNRRESIAAFASGLPRDPGAAYQSRGSLSGQGSQSGSSFNLQLDIMDDIAEAKARAKEKRKVSWTPAPTLDEAQREALKGGPKRRASELPSLTFRPAGIVCSNSDLINIISPLTSSAGEVGAGSDKEIPTVTVNPNTGSPTLQKSILDKKRKLFKDRSNSFDVCAPSTSTSNWFSKRHQPIAKKKEEQKSVVVTFTDEKLKTSILVEKPKSPEKSPEVHKVVWDDKSGSVVDAQALGSAIEVFLNRRSSQGTTSTPKGSPTKVQPRASSSTPSTTWLAGTKEGEDEPAVGPSEPCESSICTALKDLFVK